MCLADWRYWSVKEIPIEHQLQLFREPKETKTERCQRILAGTPKPVRTDNVMFNYKLATCLAKKLQPTDTNPTNRNADRHKESKK